MFNFHKKKYKYIKSPITGVAKPIEEAPDDVFAQRILGPGLVIIPENTVENAHVKVFSPIDGKIVQVFATNHAYTIVGADGLEVLVHIGINTVELKGKGFKNFVKNTQKVNIKTEISNIDIDYITQSGYNPCTPVVILNSDNFCDFEFNYGEVIASETEIIKYVKK
ncbi:MAG: PTS glucose transporter subunit IIA [Candidatus Improbicoccus devescovinae]|nr:MAG: PTS glucose transporter subunit IIA [Candidatus Improbicoccus devescovinae]